MSQKNLINGLDEPVFILDVDVGHLVECNKAATRFFKLSRAKLLKINPFELVRDSSLTSGSLFCRIHIDYTGCKLPCERLEQIGSLPTRDHLLRSSIKTGRS